MASGDFVLETPFLDETLLDLAPEEEGEQGVVGQDNRVRIKTTASVPWRWICKVSLVDSKGRPHSGGTGVLVSDRHVLTAAHVVYPEYVNPAEFTIVIVPGLNELDEPFGAHTLAGKPKIPKKYDPDAEQALEWDYALLTLRSRITDPGNTLFARPNDPRTLNGKTVLTAGYPLRRGGKQLWCASGILHTVDPRRRTMFITADTTRGQSGSPVWVKEDGRYCLVGIAAGAGKQSNTVVRVTDEFVKQLRKWITDDGDVPAMSETHEAFEPEVTTEAPFDAFEYDVSFTSGESLPEVQGPEGLGEEFYDPAKSGNPLLDISGKNRSKRLSKNLTAGELARSGSTNFSKARIDPELVESLQKLRDFVRAPLDIIDGYYSFKYLSEVAKKQKLSKVPDSPHLSGRGAKFKVSGLSPLEVAKAVIFSCPDDTRVSVGDSSVALYVKQTSADPSSFIKNGEKREGAIQTLRRYRELWVTIPRDILLLNTEDKGVEFGTRLAHWAVHEKQVRDEQTLAEVVFYKSYYVFRTRLAYGLSGRIQQRKEMDRKLWDEVLAKSVRPVTSKLKAPAEQRGGVPTTPKGERVLAEPKPDTLRVDITGRYEVEHKSKGQSLGKTMCVNQAGTRVELVMTEVLSPKAPLTSDRPIYGLYGDLVDGTSFKLFSRREPSLVFHLVPRGTKLEFQWEEAGKPLRETFTRVSASPILTRQAMSMLGKAEPLVKSYEWYPLLQSQIAHLRKFFADTKKLDGFLKAFYGAEGNFLTQHKENDQAEEAKKFNDAIAAHVKDATAGIHDSDVVLARFYIRYLLTVQMWKPSSSYPNLSQLDWIYRMVAILKEYSAHSSTRMRMGYDVSNFDEIVKYLGADPAASTDTHVHTYRATLKLKGAAVFAGYFRGSITIEKTDDRKWPDGKATFGVWFAAFGSSFKVGKKKGGVGPIKMNETYTGKCSSTFGWLPHDFPGRVDLALGGASASAGVKGSAEGGFLHIHGRGGFPVLQVIFGDADLGVGGSPNVSAELLGAIGKIRDKKFPDTEYPSMKEQTDYGVIYGMPKAAHFGYDSAVLPEEARQTLRTMCANELVALMSPESSLTITGHTDVEGEDQRNLTLSALRAANTRQAIEDIMGNKLAIPGDRITAKGLGEAEAKKAGDTKRNADRRRVDVELNGRLVLRLRAQ